MRKGIRYFYMFFLMIASTSVIAQNNNNFEIGRNTEIFMALMKELNTNYVDEIFPGKLTRTALEGMLESLDPYTNYISEADVEEFRFMTTGEYGGIGVLTHTKGDTIVISEVHDNSPAAKAGIKAGDRVLEVNGESAIGKSDNDIALIIKGQPGIEIQFKVLSPGKNLVKSLALKRETIKLGNIPFSTVIKPGIGYISLERFTQGATRDVKNAFDKLFASDSLTGLIIDLRGNGGGLLNEAVGICNLFVGKGQHIVSTKGRFQSRSQEYGTTLEAVAPNLPLVILVNGTSASASEIVAGALQDIDRAVIIGDKTYGKGLVQNIVPLPYNAQVKITVAKYYIPSGRCIQAIDYQNRDSEGKGLAIPDQLHKSFTTKGGRFVRDAGGIEPDIKIDTSNAYLRLSSIITGLYLFDFSTIYASQHETIAKAADFISNDQLFESFYGYLERNNYPMTSDLQKYFKDFSDVYTNNGTDSLLQISYNRMVEDFKANALSEVRKNKELVKDWLKIEIVSRYYGQRGRIEAAIGSNQAVSAAIRVLTDKSAYDSILAGTYPACHNKKH
ncbi:MAG TPA: peptidase S41 [Bacteroidales bacterium]|nr:MAG: hypothetical protein A2X11_14845 [Bacteroidetes bacterium GWE2_42_24]OFY31627.1 MAG: hypothetical protein A2X09_08590 [Bacteroidetes bacterium GWF2_43_11]HAQ64434.1 peptidase S41 [Bacteroidales bacterium]HBZ67116.1 peptidase S41 [Bacteroidales bacterium]